ncbi:hypothetical protein PybrP1_001512 [[Pythium] brassicae (nom. inval.)]|nr:hypothetical protein PybrP1_001512 [[Pythium] brassicae (nom. inval.)]
MLFDQRRKRGRGAPGALRRAPASVRRPNAPSPSPSPPQPPPPAARAAATRILAALPRFPEAQRSPPSPPLWTRRAGAAQAPRSSAPEPEDALTPRADVQRLVRHAHRARALLLDRLAVVNMRRMHRCELAEELARLGKVLAATQAQVDAFTRDIATMDRLIRHLQQISSIFDAGAAEGGGRLAVEAAVLSGSGVASGDAATAVGGGGEAVGIEIEPAMPRRVGEISSRVRVERRRRVLVEEEEEEEENERKKNRAAGDGGCAEQEEEVTTSGPSRSQPAPSESELLKARGDGA